MHKSLKYSTKNIIFELLFFHFKKNLYICILIFHIQILQNDG